ncbi:MAG: TlpA family protein disulfide reductase [Rubrivivax sp.]|jgi:peroxiredoxin|nr:TlpA family protein disulfide reductase [Rubrivivax sp.]
MAVVVPSLARRQWLGWGGAALAAITLPGCSARGPAPEFSYTLLDGRSGRMADLRGKVLLVKFWATSCAPCVQEMPQVVALHERYKARGFDTLAVAMRHDAPASVARFAETRALPFGVAIDNTGAIAHAWGDVQVTPTSFVVDRQGLVVRHDVGVPDFRLLQGLVERLLVAA